ncbi:unnamed protein product [Malus baccata var. baccata]
MATSRNWNDNEEDVLLTILEEMVVDGVRCETGSFKAGTFVMVATKMREMIPGINIEPKHIQNKLKRLKEKYSSKHPNASYKLNKSFPLYPRLCTMFGRDRATGSMVESAADAMENMAVENEDCDETFEMPPTSPTPSPFVGKSSASQPIRKRKRNKNDADANIVAVIREGWDKAVTEMKNLGESFTLREAKAKLPSQLKAMGIPYDQVLKISMKLVKDTDMFSFWCTLDDSDKPDFIKMFMDDI